MHEYSGPKGLVERHRSIIVAISVSIMIVSDSKPNYTRGSRIAV